MFSEIGRAIAIQSVRKSSKSELSSRFFGNLKIFGSDGRFLRYKLSEIQIGSHGYPGFVVVVQFVFFPWFFLLFSFSFCFFFVNTVIQISIGRGWDQTARVGQAVGPARAPALAN